MPRAQDRELLRAVGARIRQARQAHGWTQEQLADRVGLQASAISRIESGHLGFTMTMGGHLARALGVPYGRLLEGSDPHALSIDERALLDVWRRLPNERRHALLSVLAWCGTTPAASERSPAGG